MVRAAINGYGRIGRVAHRVILAKHSSEVDVVAINVGTSTDLTGWMYLLKYDTNYGRLGHEVSIQAVPKETNETERTTDLLGSLIIDGKEIPVYSQKDATLLPWKELDVDVVIEATGHFLTKEKAQAHIAAGAKAVVMSAPAKDPSDSSGQVPTYVISVNDKEYKGEAIISNASCTTNNITPIAAIMEKHFGIEKAMMTTIHGYTSDQELQDGGHKDYRRARAAAENIVPTSTGATIAAAKALPSLTDKFTGVSIRVPVSVGSLSDFTFLLKKSTTKEEVNEVLTEEAAHHGNKGIFTVTEDPLVSRDIVGDSHSSIADLSLTQVVGGNMVKVVAWYDNEWGYSNRLVEEVIMVGSQLQI